MRGRGDCERLGEEGAFYGISQRAISNVQRRTAANAAASFARRSDSSDRTANASTQPKDSIDSFDSSLDDLERDLYSNSYRSTWTNYYESSYDVSYEGWDTSLDYELKNLNMILAEKVRARRRLSAHNNISPRLIPRRPPFPSSDEVHQVLHRRSLPGRRSEVRRRAYWISTTIVPF